MMTAMLRRLRGKLPLLLTAGAGFLGYKYVKHHGAIQVDDGVTAVSAWQVAASVGSNTVTVTSTCVLLLL